MHDLLCERLATLQLRRGSRRAKACDTRSAYGVSGARYQRAFWSDDHQVNGELCCHGGGCPCVCHIQGMHARLLRYSGVARRGVDLGDSRIGSERTDERVLAGPGANHQQLHVPKATRRPTMG